MRKLSIFLVALAGLSLAGCYDTTQEITLKEDGSGTVTNSMDLSGLMTVAKTMGGAEEMEKAGDKKIDSTLSLAEGVDSIQNLTPEEKKMASTGTLHIQMDLKGEKFITNLSFPFSKPGDIPAYNSLSNKILGESMKDQAGGIAGGGDAEMPAMTFIDDYYSYEFSNGELKRKVIKEKYEKAGEDEYLKSLQESSGLGLTMKVNYIINLPRPVKAVEGKNVKLSDDKKKVTISSTLDEFLADASALEFKIKY